MILVGGAIAVLAGSASASTLSFYGYDAGLGETIRLPSHPNSDAARNSFLANLVGVGTENFEGFGVGPTPSLPINFVGAGTATLNGSTNNIQNVPTGTNGVGRYPISGNQFLEASNLMTISFTNPIAAFGFYGVDVGDFGGQITLTLQGGGTELVTVPAPINAVGGSVLYFGIIRPTGPAITSIVFGNTASGTDFFGFDDMTIGAPEQVQIVPLPAGAWMGLAGLGGVLGLRVARRR